MERVQERIAEIVVSLRAQGYRLTPQRMAILRALIGNRDHPDVEELYECVRIEYPQISLATIYKLVNLLKERGEILEIDLGNSGAHYDGNNPAPHAHLICVECGAIEDVEVFGTEWFICIEQEVAQKTGYRITKCCTDFFGICPRCQQESEK